MNKIEAAKDNLKKKRLEFEPVRSKIHAYANTLYTDELKGEEYKFINSVISYFPSGQWPIHTTSSKIMVRGLELAGKDSAYDIVSVI